MCSDALLGILKFMVVTAGVVSRTKIRKNASALTYTLQVGLLHDS